MRSMPAAFRRAISEGRVDYTNTLEFTFADSTTLTLTNENIALGGAKMDDAVSDDGVFQVGAVIVNSATFTLVNIERDLDGYEFGGAQVVWYVGMDDLDDDTDATPGDGAVKMGTFYVDETEYDGHMITLRCLDNAGKLDIPFDWSTVIPTLGNGPTVLQIIQGACYQGGISWSVYSDPSAMYSYVVAPPDSLENTTCRQAMSWALQIAGLFGRCNADGQMVTGWYKSHVWTPTTSDLYGGYFDETTQSTYQSGDTADGGSFNPWDAGSGSYDGGNFSSYDDIDLIQSVFSQKLSLKDVEITGVKVSYKTGDGGASSSVNERSIGTAGYIISIDDNPLINTKLDAVLSRDTVGDILDYLGNVVLIGMRFRAGEIVHPSDPAIEAGDVGYYWDIHQEQHAILISSTEFSGGVTQRTVSSASSKENNASTRYSNTTRNYTDIMSAINGDYIRNQLLSYGQDKTNVLDTSAINTGFTNTGHQLSARIEKHGNMVILTGEMKTGSALNAAAYTGMFRLPSGYRPRNQIFFKAFREGGTTEVTFYTDPADNDWIRLLVANSVTASTIYRFTVSYTM